MATLIRRDNREGRHVAAPVLDPFRLVDAFFGGGGFADGFAPVPEWSAPRGFAPTFDVREAKDAYVFKADIPGVAEADLEIQLTGNVLTISGERKTEAARDGERAFAAERTYGKFTRAFSLPDGIDGDHVTADVKLGVLTVVVPKRPEVQPRRISIGTNGAAKA